MRLRFGLISVATFQLIYVVVQFLQVPLLLSTWGADRYGAWLLLQIAQLVAARADLGLSIATSKEVMLQLHRGDPNRGVRIYRAMLSGVVLLQITTFAAVMAFTLATSSRWGLDMDPGDILRAICWMTLAGFMMAQIEALYAAFYATGRNALGMFIRAFGQLSWLVALGIAVLSGADIPVAAFALFIGYTIPVFVAALVLTIGRSPLRPSFGRELRLLKPLAAPSLTLATLPLAQIISLSAPRLLIAAAVNPAMLAAFNAHRQMTRVISLVFGLSLAFEPLMTTAKAQGDRQRFLNLAVDCQTLVAGTAACAAVGLAAISPFFFEYWTRGELKLSWMLFVPLVFAAVLEAVWRSVLSALTAANEHIRAGLTYLGFNIVGFAVIWPLVQVPALASPVSSWGLVAIEFATVVCIAMAFQRNAGLAINDWRSLVSKRLRGGLDTIRMRLGRKADG